jgi:parallel beta-helix repeat protein
LYCKNAFPSFINCSFENNAAGTIGGGAHCVKGGPSFNTCRFSSNSANRGGGVYTFRSAATFTGCLFDYNDSVYFGGGMYSYQNSPSGEPLRLINCMIKDNLANSGGGIFLSEADNVFEKNCLIESNTAIQAGGGMYCVASSNPSITDCTFKFNEAKVDSGGGIRIVDSSPGPGISDTQFCSNFHNGGHIGGNLFGNHEDLGGNEFLQECSNCPDINGDGFVNVSDLLSIIDQWGLTDSPADVNGDGIVDVSDLLEVVGNWGPCE